MTTNTADRWRLLLGRYSNDALGGCTSGSAAAMNHALGYLYDREYTKRGLPSPQHKKGKRSASLDPSALTAIEWLNKTGDLFPDSVFETLKKDAIDRYNIAELLTDPKTLDNVEPSMDLLQAMISMQGRGDAEMKAKIRRAAEQVIDEIMRKLRAKLLRSISGKRNRHLRSRMASAANFDARATIRANLKNVDAVTGRMIADDIRFFSAQKRQLPWELILVVDQSGSMNASLIYSVLMATILSNLPGIKIKMLLFDTLVVDVTSALGDDPLDLLLSVQLGGGTDIGQALEAAESMVETPTRTAIILITDFYEGGRMRRLLATTARLHTARVKLLGLAALDDSGLADFDRSAASQLEDLGMHIAAMTPDHLADWLAEIMQ